jgi:hypothetical protein
MNYFNKTSQESIEKWWRATRHCEKSPNCRIVPGVKDSNGYPEVYTMRTIKPGDELTINFRDVPVAALEGFPRIAAIIADKLAAHDKGSRLYDTQ